MDFYYICAEVQTIIKFWPMDKDTMTKLIADYFKTQPVFINNDSVGK